MVSQQSSSIFLITFQCFTNNIGQEGKPIYTNILQNMTWQFPNIFTNKIRRDAYRW